MKITIIGAGRAGRSFNAALRSAGHDVSLVHHDQLVISADVEMVLLCVPDDALIDTLAEALVDVWQRLGLPFKPSALAAE